MKQTIKILLAIYLMIGGFFSFSVSGIATDTVINNAGINLHYDDVYQVKQAYIDNHDNLYVCVDGKYSEKRREYWIGVPVVKIEKIPEKLDHAYGDFEYWKESYKQLWHLPRANIVVMDCSKKPTNEQRTVEIRVIDAAMTSSYKTEDILNDNFSLASERELVYQLNVTDGAGKPIDDRDLAYANKKSVFGKNHAFTFKTNYYRQRGSVVWYLLLPFAWALDVIIWPIELAVWAEYADAH